MRLSILIISYLALGGAASAATFHNESEAGVVLASGNSPSQSFNLRQMNSNEWSKNLVRFDARFLKSKSKGIESAYYWTAGLRYERGLSEFFRVFAAQAVESDKYAGYLQRYNTDVGGKYFFAKTEAKTWFAEAGYRYTSENRIVPPDKRLHYMRLYTEAERAWDRRFSAKLWVEHLPNFTESSDWQLNSEASITAQMNEVFSLKTAYLLRYDHLPAPTAIAKTDTLFTTSLVAKL